MSARPAPTELKALGQGDEPDKPKRGRPKTGDPILVRLAPEQRMLAETLGGGVAAQGVRIALLAAQRLGVQTVQVLAKSMQEQQRDGDESSERQR